MILINSIKSSQEQTDVNVAKHAYYFNLKINSLGNYALKYNTGRRCLIHQMVDGLLNDFYGVPAVQSFKNGKLLEINHYSLGKLNDVDELNPAILEFWPNGNIRTLCRFKDNKANNSEKGEPASIRYFENGKVKIICYYKDNMLDDLCETAAYTTYDETGKILIKEHYNKGQKIG